MLIPLLLADVIALKGATVHTLEPGSAPAVATVLIELDRITAVGPDVAVPGGARVVDLTGLHLLPGLVDGMVNLDPDHDRLYVASGITLVRDVGNDLARIQAEQLRPARDRGPGPWLWSAGAVLDGFPPSTTACVILATTADVESKLPRLLDNERDTPPDYFAFQPGLPHEAWRKVIELAHARQRQVWGPVLPGLTLADAAAGGQDGVLHLDALLPPGKGWADVTAEDLAPAVEIAAQHGLAITPTLALWGRSLVEPKEDAPELELLGPEYAETWLADARMRRSLATLEHLEKGRKVFEAQSRLVKQLHERGVELVPGSATPFPWLLPGAALLDELLVWHRAGIPAADCVRAATAGACASLGVELRGTIRKGKVADLIATRGDPEQDLGALRQPAFVVLRGRVLDRTELDRLVAELRARQAQRRAERARPIEVAAPDLPAGDVVLQGHVETYALGTRISAERFAVVRRFDGGLVYCGRLRVPGEASVAETETAVQQVFTGGKLASFAVKILSAGREIALDGEVAGGKLNVTQRVDGGFGSMQTISQRIALVDCGSVTAWLILGYHEKPGRSNVLFFEAFEPAVGPWEMRLDPDCRRHYLKLPGGGQAIAEIDERGLPVLVRRTLGKSEARTILLDATVEGGRGLPMPAEKKALAGKLGAQAEPAQAPQPAPGGTPPR